jgi:hypothetical protein
LDLSDSEVRAANESFFNWIEQGDRKAAGNTEAEQRFNFEKTVFYVDIGFNDPEYLQEVLDQLDQDLGDIESPELAAEVQAKIAEIEGKLGITE